MNVAFQSCLYDYIHDLLQNDMFFKEFVTVSLENNIL